MIKDWSKEDAAQRERLERNSSAGQRADMAGAINRLAKVHSDRELPSTLIYGALLNPNGKAAAAMEARVHNQNHDTFERLHPQSELRRSGDEKTQRMLNARGGVPDAVGSMTADAQTHSDKWSSGQVEPVEPDFLTVEAMRAIAAAKVRNSRFF